MNRNKTKKECITFLSKASFLLKKDFLLDCLDFFNKINTENLTENEANFYKNEIEYFYDNDIEKAYEKWNKLSEQEKIISRFKFF